jgi:hypothetical protein
VSHVALHDGLVKIFCYLQRGDNVSEGRFHALWRHPHGTLAKDVHTFRRYVQAHRISGIDAPGLRAPHDGVAELWFSTVEDGASLGENEYYRNIVIPDEQRFMSLSKDCFRVLTRAYHLRGDSDLSGRSVKLIHSMRKRADIPIEDFREALLGEDELQLGESLGARSHCISLAMVETYGEVFVPFDGQAHQWRTPDPYDAVRELWWSDLHELQSSISDHPAQWRAILSAGGADVTRSHGFIVDELVIVTGIPQNLSKA